jgi:hypothetical protein
VPGLEDGGHNHVTDTTSGQSVQASTNTLDGDDVEVSGTGVVSAVHDGTAGEGVSLLDRMRDSGRNRTQGDPGSS